MEIKNLARPGYEINASSAVVSEEKRQEKQPVNVESAAADNVRPAVEDSYTAMQYAPDQNGIGYTQPKRLSAEQVRAMKEQIHESMRQLAYKMLGLQADKVKQMDSGELTDALGLGRTPEEAAEAISENGMWGVNAVAGRLMAMAISLSDGDSGKAEILREAVKKGFEAVGVMETLPEVCQNTYTEVMCRFDYWEENGTMDGYGEE